MVDFFSEAKTVQYPNTEVFQILSDLRNLRYLKDHVPEDGSMDKLDKFQFEEDSCSVSVDPVGSVKFNVVDRQPDSLIKLEAEKTPFALHLFIEIGQISENETRLQVVAKAELNAFIKTMVSKPLQKAVDTMVEMISLMPYDEVKNQNSEQ